MRHLISTAAALSTLLAAGAAFAQHGPPVVMAASPSPMMAAGPPAPRRIVRHRSPRVCHMHHGHRVCSRTVVTRTH